MACDLLPGFYGFVTHRRSRNGQPNSQKPKAKSRRPRLAVGLFANVYEGCDGVTLLCASRRCSVPEASARLPRNVELAGMSAPIWRLVLGLLLGARS